MPRAVEADGRTPSGALPAAYHSIDLLLSEGQ